MKKTELHFAGISVTFLLHAAVVVILVSRGDESGCAGGGSDVFGAFARACTSTSFAWRIFSEIERQYVNKSPTASLRWASQASRVGDRFSGSTRAECPSPPMSISTDSRVRNTTS